MENVAKIQFKFVSFQSNFNYFPLQTDNFDWTVKNPLMFIENLRVFTKIWLILFQKSIIYCTKLVIFISKMFIVN